MKKFSIILVLSILMTLFVPGAGAVTGFTPEDGAYIVKLKDTGADTARLFSGIDAYEISESASLYRVDSYADIEKLGGSVEYYEKDDVATLFGLTNDKYTNYQWNLEYIGVDAAWDSGYNGKGIRVGIIDSGVNSMHEDFDGTNFARGANTIDGSYDVTDNIGHGTFVAGTLAAVKNNGLGIAGLCDDITIVPIKCFDAKDTLASYVISGIYEAIDTYGCDVINISNGVTSDMTSMRNAIAYAESKGVIVVAAAGNDGNSKIFYPAAYPSVICVGAVDSNGVVTDFSQKNETIFVTAPGKDLVGIGYESTDSYIPKAYGAGTSYAVPHVVAAAVILKQLNSSANSGDFQNILKASVRDAGAAGYDTSYGYGILDLREFVAVMKGYEFDDIGGIFPDVQGHWAEDSIAFCYNNGYFTGVSATSFAPETLMDRAMFVTVLSRVSGENISGYPNSFSDVKDGQYYTQACGWGSATGIVKGSGETTFSPNGNVNREQMAVFLYRYALAYGLTEYVTDTSNLKNFSDAGSVSSFAEEALSWAVANGLITGRTATTLVPGGSAKRCEVATIIDRFAETFLGE